MENIFCSHLFQTEAGLRYALASCVASSNRLSSRILLEQSCKYFRNEARLFDRRVGSDDGTSDDTCNLDNPSDNVVISCEVVVAMILEFTALSEMPELPEVPEMVETRRCCSTFVAPGMFCI